jgi:hypothetical protein
VPGERKGHSCLPPRPDSCLILTWSLMQHLWGRLIFTFHVLLFSTHIFSWSSRGQEAKDVLFCLFVLFLDRTWGGEGRGELTASHMSYTPRPFNFNLFFR